MRRDLSRVFIGLGSNLGDREENLRRALSRLNENQDIVLESTSRFLESAPWGVIDQPSFLNGAALVRTTLSPLDLLRALKTAERSLGRVPDGPRWGPRVIDLDILLFDDRVIDTEELTVPHPRLTERDFAMIPLIELDPEARHPVNGLPLRVILDEMQQTIQNR